MNKHNQNGSALVIVVIVLIVAVIGALGFVVWKNLISKEDATANENTSVTVDKTEQEVKYKTAQIDATFPASLSWTYPENWTIKSEGSGPKDSSDTTTQKFTLTSPNNKYEVVYYVGINGGLGGICEPNGDTLKSVNRIAVPDSEKFVFMETIAGTALGYAYKSALYKNNSDTQAVSEGNSTCNIYLRNIIPLNEDESMVILAAEINIKEFDSSDEYRPAETYPSEISTLEEAFNDSEYKDAVKILLSTVSN